MIKIISTLLLATLFVISSQAQIEYIRIENTDLIEELDREENLYWKYYCTGDTNSLSPCYFKVSSSNCETFECNTGALVSKGRSLAVKFKELDPKAVHLFLEEAMENDYFFFYQSSHIIDQDFYRLYSYSTSPNGKPQYALFLAKNTLK